MSEVTVEQKKLPLTQESDLVVLLLIPATYYLYGLYWLDKQSSKLKQNFGIVPFNENLIKYGYISYGLMALSLAISVTYPSLSEIDQSSKTIILYLLFASPYITYITFFIYLYCSFRYASTISKMLGHKKTDLLVLIGTFMFHAAFLNWWQNSRARKQSELSVNSNF